MKKLVAVMAVVIVLLVGAVAFLFLQKDNAAVSAEDAAQTADSTRELTYATGLTVISEDGLQKAVKEAISKNGNIGVSYQRDAFSEDGLTFSCYFANSKANDKDMYIGLYDESMEEELFLSGLMPPGQAFEEVTLNRALEPGDHSCVLSMTLVEDDHQTVYGQTLLGVVLHVA